MDILDLYFNLSEGEPINNIKKRINENKFEYFKNKKIDLPDVIISPRDLFIQKKELQRSIIFRINLFLEKFWTIKKPI